MPSSPLQIAIDRAGRVVLPKNIRDRIGLRPGVELEVTEKENSILLTPVAKEPVLAAKGGILVVVPEESGSAEEILEIQKKQREARNKKAW